MTLLTNVSDRKKIGLHALLIGVGSYPHLNGGDPDSQFSLASGMGQLTSPYHSVTEFANWLQQEMNLAASPLRSLRVLASTGTDAPSAWEHPTIDAIRRSTTDWFEDIDTAEENFALFYFCGHGVLLGSVVALLAEGFGSEERNPFKDSFEPQTLESAMLSSKAARQLFLIDACSASPQGFKGRYDAIMASVLIQPVKHDRLGITKQAEIRASELGTAAYGQPGKPSVFMEAFLKSMRGAGAIKDSRGNWVVKTNSLRTGVDWLTQRSEKTEVQLVSFGTVSADFAFHELSSVPIVPVKVICEPEEVHGYNLLDASSGDVRDEPSPDAWHFDVPLGMYKFRARDVSSGETYEKDEYASPQYTVVRINCGGMP